MKRVLLGLIIIVASLEVNAQNAEEFFAKSSNINKTGMMILGGWAISNIAYGAYGNFSFENERKYFNQMNMMWNFVNLGIAGFALYQSQITDISSLTIEQMVDNHTKTQNLYLINAGLDILYMAGGMYMIHASKTSKNQQMRLKGYGQSVILQGGFLFAFDLVMYAIQRNHLISFNSSAYNLTVNPMGVGLTLNF